MTGGLSRRAFIGGIALAAAGPAAAAAEHPSVTYMKKVAKDLLAAHRQGTVSSFLVAIRRHADVNAIANYSLGNYQSKLGNGGQRQRYYNGVATFMARYFADQSREYPVAKYTLGEATADPSKDVWINSKVHLTSGQVYTVAWRLAWRGGRYKVADVKMLGFSLVYLQRGIFQSYLSKKNGDVSALVAALNR